ncbi:hypothetical protein AB0F25_28130 [Streptomyces wedmorensis]|uniref:hypothetical protein n=1 Tax=Streptomyces wedmorensis TaxID=43759 RepID=UPI0034488845
MTDSEETPQENEEQLKYPDVVEPVLDLDLRLLVLMVNTEENRGTSVSITLHVPGGLVSGELIGREDYLDRLDRVASGAGMSGIVGFRRKAAEVLREAGVRKTDDLPRWIHLQDAAVVGPNGRLLTFPVWRGRLADVAGWSLGAFR